MATAARPKAATARAARQKTRTSARKTLFSQMKNEAPFVLEWIAYHKIIGFDQIVICSNPSTDGMEELLAALAEAGEIRHLRVTPGPTEGALRVGSATFSREVGYEAGDWYMWLDGDEFLNVHAGDRTVDALIEAMGDRIVAPVSWRVFGTGGNGTFPGRFIDPAFTGAAEPGFKSNLEQKSFFRVTPAVRGFGLFGINRPAFIRGAGVTADDIMMGNGGPALASDRITERWLYGADIGKTAWVRPEEFGWTHAQINHYVLRTPEFYRLKRARGRGYTPNPDKNGLQRYTDAFFAEHDRNEAEDRSILHWRDAVTAEIDRLLAYPAVAAAKAQSDALVSAALEAVAQGKLPAQPKAVPTNAAAVGRETEGDAKTESEPTFELTFEPRERAFVEHYYKAASTILEYGSGGSTVLAAKLGRTVFSVESDRAWAERLSKHLSGLSAKAHVHYADVGPTGPWGMPVRLRDSHKFHGYALSVWDRADFQHPDLVLIDGRFRAACLVAVLTRASRPVTVLFDDYLRRRRYHAVERLARKEEMVGRMARFTVTPGAIPHDMVTQAIGWFTDPR